MTAGYERIWQTIIKVSICMLTTRTSGGDLRARPVEARPDRRNDCLYFLTDANSAKEHEIHFDPRVGLTFIDPRRRLMSLLPRARRYLPTPQKPRSFGQKRTGCGGEAQTIQTSFHQSRSFNR